MESLPHHHQAVRGDLGLHADKASLGDHHEDDAASIPGSPTHPIDHDCFQCQVLKHLSRCVLVPPQLADVALPAGTAVRPVARTESQQDGRIAALPPARGPPSRLA